MLHWTLVLGSSAPHAAVPGSACRPAQLALPHVAPSLLAGQSCARVGSPQGAQAAQAGTALQSAEHLIQAMAPSLRSEVADQLALSVGANAAMPQHSLPAVHDMQAMQPHSSSGYTDQLLSLVLLQGSSANGQPAFPAPGQPPQQGAYPLRALHEAGPGTGHQGPLQLQAAHTSSAGVLDVTMQPQQQQQSSAPSPRMGAGGLQGPEPPHTSAFIHYQRPAALRSSHAGCALSAVGGALMRQDKKELRRPQPMVPVTSPPNVPQDSPLSKNLPR